MDSPDVYYHTRCNGIAFFCYGALKVVNITYFDGDGPDKSIPICESCGVEILGPNQVYKNNHLRYCYVNYDDLIKTYEIKYDYKYDYAFEKYITECLDKQLLKIK